MFSVKTVPATSREKFTCSAKFKCISDNFKCISDNIDVRKAFEFKPSAKLCPNKADRAKLMGY